VTRLSKRRIGGGTLLYMSPQQQSGDMCTPLDDLYSVGATLYELLTSKPPFYMGNVDRQIHERVAPRMADRRKELGRTGEAIPAVWEEVVASCLAKKPEDRPLSARELIKALTSPKPAPPVILPEPVAVAGPSTPLWEDAPPSDSAAAVSEPPFSEPPASDAVAADSEKLAPTLSAAAPSDSPSSEAFASDPVTSDPPPSDPPISVPPFSVRPPLPAEPPALPRVAIATELAPSTLSRRPRFALTTVALGVLGGGILVSFAGWSLLKPNSPGAAAPEGGSTPPPVAMEENGPDDASDPVAEQREKAAKEAAEKKKKEEQEVFIKNTEAARQAVVDIKNSEAARQAALEEARKERERAKKLEADYAAMLAEKNAAKAALDKIAAANKPALAAAAPVPLTGAGPLQPAVEVERSVPVTVAPVEVAALVTPPPAPVAPTVASEPIVSEAPPSQPGTPAGSSEPPVVAASPTIEERIEAFVQTHLDNEAAVDAKGRHVYDRMLADYDKKVDYIDHKTPASHDDIRTDQISYLSQWPVGREYIEGKPTISKDEAKGEWKVNFTSRFERSNPQNRKQRNGTAQNEYGIKEVDGELKITRQKVSEVKVSPDVKLPSKSKRKS
jgi:hypothetical protein